LDVLPLRGSHRLPGTAWTPWPTRASAGPGSRPTPPESPGAARRTAQRQLAGGNGAGTGSPVLAYA
jgi:hypothetical protein